MTKAPSSVCPQTKHNCQKPLLLTEKSVLSYQGRVQMFKQEEAGMKKKVNFAAVYWAPRSALSALLDMTMESDVKVRSTSRIPW